MGQALGLGSVFRDARTLDESLPAVPFTLNSDSKEVSLIMFSLNIVEYPMSFLLLSTWNDLGGWGGGP